MSFVIDPPVQPSVSIKGGGKFPVRRIFCIGRNYDDHVREMGGDPKNSTPVFFTKPADAVAPDGATLPYPQGTSNLHFEGELVLALKSGGRDIKSADAAKALIYGYAAGCDLTRRDLQNKAKDAQGPWDTAKGFDHSAPIGEIVPADELLGGLASAQLATTVNGDVRQHAPLSMMIWSPEEIIMFLSELFELKAGDLIFTGTPEGVGELTRGDQLNVTIGVHLSLDFAIAS
ncbi:fumarylacetoacetate hydrolase family protein [Hyphococcus sp. DH-69]|uniref:fumarylacetoacetate hydrolase family protein n=1 Tax=Hyphococcus formosus TaxID=3143534 RepID=UPI00398BB40E